MKIGVDARELEFNPHGVGRVLRNILKAWSENPLNHRFVLYFKNALPEIDLLDSPAFEKKLVSLPAWLNRDRIWEQICIPRCIDKDRIDVFFSPSYTIPLKTRCPTAVILHDISYQTHPEWFSFRQGLFYRGLTRWSVRRAAKIICCSNFTRREVLTQYGKNLENKISTIYWAPQEHFQFSDKDARKNLLADKYQITQPFFLFVGAPFKRRNVPLLRQSFKRVLKKHPDHLLVLIGAKTVQTGKLNAQDRVRSFDYMNDEDLAAFYQEASCLVYPSIYEGFGLPVIEAMACGVPVIIPNSQAVAEVAAGAAMIVDPLNEANLAEAMSAVVENQNLRRELIEKGSARVQKLSWQETASTILNLLAEAGTHAGS
ncbi:MAG: glycosyltransferase family 4 protein [Nitrospinales bacterium]